MQIDTSSKTGSVAGEMKFKLLDFLDIEEWARDITPETAQERIWEQLNHTARGLELDYVRNDTKDKMASLKTTRFVPGKLEGDSKYHETVIGSSLVATIVACLDMGGSLMKVVFYWGVDTVQLGLQLERYVAEHKNIVDLEEEIGRPLTRPLLEDAEFEVYDEKFTRINELEARCKQEYDARGAVDTRSSSFEATSFYEKFLVEKKAIEAHYLRKAAKFHHESVIQYKLDKVSHDEKKKQLDHMKKI